MYDRVYLAPHLDDVALSCGGQIAAATRAGEAVLIVTVTAGDPPSPALSDYVHGLHARWELATDATAARRAEDLAACALLGAEARHWTLPDCIYRHDPVTGRPYYTSDAELFGQVAPAEWTLVEDLAAYLGELPRYRELVAPLGVGNHVDHQLARLAAERTVGRDRLVYYEDYPYAEEPGATDAVVRGLGDGWQVEITALDEAALAAKCDAVAAYRSQLSTFFIDRAELDARVRGFAARVGGERRWRSLPMVQ